MRLCVIVALVVAGCASHGSHRPVVAASAITSSTTSTVAPTTTTVDPGTLPQTADQPSTTDPAFQARIGALWSAVVSGNAAAGLPAFFPLTAYLQVKAIADPAADWQNRLVAQFDADIARVHATLPANADLVGVAVPAGAATWVKPGAEFNKIGYWRVYGSVVSYRSGGRTATFTVVSMISWRGQWYVVHFRTLPR